MSKLFNISATPFIDNTNSRTRYEQLDKYCAKYNSLHTVTWYWRMRRQLSLRWCELFTGQLFFNNHYLKCTYHNYYEQYILYLAPVS